jgi:hypothetical protein
MQRILFISRHAPTEGQVALFDKAGYNLRHVDIEFDDDPVRQVKRLLGYSNYYRISGVFPLDVLATLQEEFTVFCTVTTVRGLRVDLASANQLKLVTFRQTKWYPL